MDRGNLKGVQGNESGRAIVMKNDDYSYLAKSLKTTWNINHLSIEFGVELLITEMSLVLIVWKVFIPITSFWRMPVWFTADI